MSRPILRESVLACWVAALLPTLCAAQFVVSETKQEAKQAYLDVSIEAATHLRTAASYVRDGNWNEALRLFERVMEQFGDKVVQVAAGPDHSVYVSVREYCQMHILRLPPQALRLYRDQVDGRAESWFRQGVADRDERLLRRVVDRAFCSSWGDNALDALAELALEGGQFELAYSLWSQIDTGQREQEPKSPMPRLLYPDTELEPAMIEAKKVLALALAGQKRRAEAALERFRARFPDARGRLGREQGPLAGLLERILTSSARPAPGLGHDYWSTFAGNAQRSKVAEAVKIGSVQWSTELPPYLRRLSTVGHPLPAGASAADQALSYHPIIVRDWVLLCGWNEVRAYDLREGPRSGREPAWKFSLYGGRAAIRPAMPRWRWATPSYTLTVVGDRLYARLGPPETVFPRGGLRRTESYVVCLDLAAEGKELWRAAPDEPDLAYEGAPVADANHVYVALTRGGAMTHSFVACYDAHTGSLKWRRLVCEASSPGAYYGGAATHNLLTLAAGTVFYNTNRGAVAALDAASGQVRWIATYPRYLSVLTGIRSPLVSWPVNPCVYSDGLVAAVPADGHGLYVFDALTGQLRCKTTETPAIKQLLGAVDGKLICTWDRGVMAIELSSGRRVWQWPEGVGRGLRAYGRGILAGPYVYFPAHTDRGGEIFILDQKTGLPARPSVQLTGAYGQLPGNLVIGNGYLAVAHARGLTVYCEYQMLIDRYRDQLAREPGRADLHFRLARAAEATESFELAERHYRRAVELAQPGQVMEGQPLGQLARRRLFDLLLERGRQAQTQKQWSAAEKLFSQAAEAAAKPRSILTARMRLADMWLAAGAPQKALAVYQDLLAAGTLDGLIVPVEPSRSVRADLLVASRIGQLLQEHGRGIYEPYEQAARRAFQTARGDGDLAKLEQLTRLYRPASVVPQILLYLAQQYAERQRWGPAAAAYQRLLARPDADEPTRVKALFALALVRESQRAWQAGLQTWRQLQSRFPEAMLPTDPPQPAASWISQHLQEPPYERLMDAQGQVPFPVARQWSRSWEKQVRVVVPQGLAGSELQPVLLIAAADGVECVECSTGRTLWTLDTPGPVTWAAYYNDQLLIGSRRQVVGVRLATGQMIWRLQRPAEQRARPAIVPAQRLRARGHKTAAADSGAAAGLAEFHLIGERLCLRDGTRGLLCLSADSGQVQWQYTPAEGSIVPAVYFGPRRVALRTRAPAKLVVLDGNGRRRFELAGGQSPGPALPAAALDDDRLCLAVGPRTLQLVDLNSGTLAWSFQARSSVGQVLPIAAPGALLALVDGTELMRLDPQTGRKLWSYPIATHAITQWPNSWAVDEDRFYCVTPVTNNLRAFRLSDGQPAWPWPYQQFLAATPGRWQLALAPGCVVAASGAVSNDGRLSVLFCRRRDGRLVQKLQLRPTGKRAVLLWTATAALVGTDRELWALGAQ